MNGKAVSELRQLYEGDRYLINTDWKNYFGSSLLS